MQQNERYPKLRLRSKNELVKRISPHKNCREQQLKLLNECLQNYDSLWRDNLKDSEPEKEKWVRDASKTCLGKLLKQLNDKLLRPYDQMLPVFIHGGVSKKCPKTAMESLIMPKPIALKMDMHRFFEQITYNDIKKLFYEKFECKKPVAKIIAELTCVEKGKKGSQKPKVLSRGFSTSSRLAIWCNLDLFLRISWLVKKELKGYHPKIAIYADDIIIVASSRAGALRMCRLYNKIKTLIVEAGLVLNEDKTEIIDYLGTTYDEKTGKENGKGKFEMLGIELGRNKIRVGVKTRGKILRIEQQAAKNKLSKHKKKQLAGLKRYRHFVGTKSSTY